MCIDIKSFSEFITNYFDQVLVAKGLSVHTRKSYLSDLKAIEHFARQYGFVDKDVILKYLGELRHIGCAKRTFLRKISSMRALFKCLVHKNIINKNPMDSIKGPRIPLTLPKVLSEAGVQVLMDGPDTNNVLGLRDKAMMELVYSSGLRVSELIGININDISFDEGLLLVRGKGGVERVLPITANAAHWIKLYLNHVDRVPKDGGVALFLNFRGMRITARSVRRHVHKYISSSDIVDEGVSPHGLRHAIATHWLARGMDIKAIQKLLGHKSPQTTTIYTHLSNETALALYAKTHPMVKEEG